MYSVYTIQCILVYAETGSCLAIPATIVSRLAIPPKLLPIWLSLPNFFFFNYFLNIFFLVLAFIVKTIFNLKVTAAPLPGLPLAAQLLHLLLLLQLLLLLLLLAADHGQNNSMYRCSALARSRTHERTSQPSTVPAWLGQHGSILELSADTNLQFGRGSTADRPHTSRLPLSTNCSVPAPPLQGPTKLLPVWLSLSKLLPIWLSLPKLLPVWLSLPKLLPVWLSRHKLLPVWLTRWVSIGGCWGKSQSRPSTNKVRRFEPHLSRGGTYSNAPKIQTMFSNNVTVRHCTINTYL